MSQNPLEGLPRFTGYDVLILNATVRRSDDDFQRPATPATGLYEIQAPMEIQSSRGAG